MKKMIITICREFGAEGHEIGKELSERLHIPLYDKDLLAMAVEESGMRIEKAAKVDEKAEKGFFSQYLMNNENMLNDQLFAAERNMILRLAEKESCIIVGRLADYILKGKKECLRVFIYAPIEDRIRGIAEKHSISEDEASRLVRRMDSARNTYYAYYSKGRWDHRTEKDIMLDRAAFGTSGCVNILETAVHEKEK